MSESTSRMVGLLCAASACLIAAACTTTPAESSDPCAKVTTTILGMDKIFYGETLRDFTTDPNAWMQYGRDIDGLVTSAGATNVCKPIAGGMIEIDGNEGIDNSFGKNIVPLYNEFYLPDKVSVVTKAANEMIVTGLSTYLLAIDIPEDAACQSISARFYRGWKYRQSPSWDGSDVWPIDPASVMDPADLSSATAVLEEGTLADGVYRSGKGAAIALRVETQGPFIIPIHDVHFEMKLDANGKEATEGQLSGIIYTEEMVESFMRSAAQFDQMVCDSNSANYQTLVERVRRASDSLRDGTQDPTKDCDAISIGVGFSMKPAQLGEANSPPYEPPLICGAP